MKKNFLTILLAVALVSCNAQKNKEKQMNQVVTKLEELIQERLSMVKIYENKPAYYLQINKSGCRLLVSVNNIPLGHTFTEDDGETMFYPINEILLAGGKHSVSIEVFPRTFEQEVQKEAWVNIKVCRYAQKLEGQPETIAEMNTPTEIGTFNLPVFTDSLSFNAVLPFDFRYILSEAKDLNKVADLESKVLAHYNKVRKMMIDGAYYEFCKMRLPSTWPSTEMSYLGEDALKKAYIDTDDLFRFMIDPIDWIIDPIKDYEMIVCGNGKLVYLRRKKELDQVLRVHFYDSEEEKKISPDKRTVEAFKFIALYMPKGSNELVELY